MAKWETLYNPGGTPRARDGAGRLIGARSWAAGDVSNPPVARDVAAGRLRVVTTRDPVPVSGIDPAAAEAMRETLAERHADTAAAPATTTTTKAAAKKRTTATTTDDSGE